MTKSLGEIHIYAKLIVRKRPPKFRVSTRQDPLEGNIAEKALKGKAISHGTT